MEENSLLLRNYNFALSCQRKLASSKASLPASFRWHDRFLNFATATNSSGFSLFELLIVMVIMGILLSLSYPLYSEHVIHARRLEAEIMLEKLSVMLEQYYTIHNTYQDATLEKLGFPDMISKNNYTLIIAKANDTEFSLRAMPQKNQAAQDTLCAELTLNSLGIKGMTGNGSIAECWV